ncbi:DUF4426 domain-containing protein [Cellvibrio sp. KY-YJ-3]|jgi:hypothetical protein|uniref:DUF4426 domain-containing protein n=1 Tax=Cellvibrio sp. KY-YJ-3 TaxID=454662 RepID=UPI0012485B52|nr:DUF4426 domain-containing protein [Cellvibrio sp. KY-YJ-3]QEY11381.1 DUF4426 domain-containing protein [Cellvibrio sp. KY-YJ-3]
MKKLLQGFLLSLIALTAQAQIDQPKEIATQQQFGVYTVHYNVFNSTDIPANVAEAYKLVRGKDRALVNISVTKTENGATSLGLPAQVSGVRRNLMQQKQTLKFIEVSEGDATYYLAPFVFNNEELLHFDIELNVEGAARPLKLTFNRTLYADK